MDIELENLTEEQVRVLNNKLLFREYQKYASLVHMEIYFGGKTYVKPFDFKINLPDKYTLEIGLDQSTSQTGIAISVAEYDVLLCLIDVCNKGLQADKYNTLLGTILNNMLMNKKVSMFILEDTWGGGFNYSKKKLDNLMGSLKVLRERTPELRNTEFGQILPPSWRKNYLTSKSYKGRMGKNTVKECAREEICLRVPEVKGFAYRTKRVPDSLEAYGILQGYKKKNFNENGIRIVNKSGQHIKRNFNYQLIKANLAELAKEVDGEHSLYERLLYHYGKDGIYSVAKARGIDPMEYNIEMSERENMSRSCDFSKKVIVLSLPVSNLYSAYMWEDGEPVKNGENYFLVCYAVNVK